MQKHFSCMTKFTREQRAGKREPERCYVNHKPYRTKEQKRRAREQYESHGRIWVATSDHDELCGTDKAASCICRKKGKRND